MQQPTTKQQLLEQLEAERADWEALLARIGTERMEQPGVTGDWTMKETIAHLTTWWRREIACVAAAQRGERPPDHPPQTEVAVINQWVGFTNRDRPLADVLHDAQSAWQEFAAILRTFPEDALFDPQRFEWMRGRALGPGSLYDFVMHLHEEHAPLIDRWLQAS
jgi:hypothetical protein